MTQKQIGPFLGINNRLPRNKLLVKEGAFLADAVNVDLHKNGQIISREGFTLVIDMPATHSLWRNYFVSNETLYAIGGNVEAVTTTPVIAGLRRGAHLSYAEHAGKVVFTNGDDIWSLSANAASVAGVAKPNAGLVVSAAGNGVMDAGLYQLCACFVSASGERSGTTEPQAVDVQANGRVEVTGIPQQVGCTTDIYMTTCNGSQFYLVGAGVGSSFSISSNSEQGVVCSTLLLDRLPPGSIIRSHNGRLLVASGNAVFYSEPWSMLYSPSRGFFQFAEPVTMIEPCGNKGFYVSAGKTYWISGAIGEKENEQVEVAPYAAIAGTSGKRPDTNDVFWMSDRGLVVGTQDGQVDNVQEKNVAISPAAAGASVFREDQGTKQVVTSMFDVRPSTTAARTFMDAEVIHQQPA